MEGEGGGVLQLVTIWIIIMAKKKKYFMLLFLCLESKRRKDKRLLQMSVKKRGFRKNKTT